MATAEAALPPRHYALTLPGTSTFIIATDDLATAYRQALCYLDRQSADPIPFPAALVFACHPLTPAGDRIRMAAEPCHVYWFLPPEGGTGYWLDIFGFTMGDPRLLISGVTHPAVIEAALEA